MNGHGHQNMKVTWLDRDPSRLDTFAKRTGPKTSIMAYVRASHATVRDQRWR
jgi:hypothetical protein